MRDLLRHGAAWIRSRSESDVSAMTSQFEAVIETESRAHYTLRDSMMTAEGTGEAAAR